MDELKFGFNSKNLKALEKHLSGDRIGKKLLFNMVKAANVVQRATVLNLSNRVLKRQTGRLANSIVASVRGNGMSVTGLVGTNVVYGAIHEFGGTVKTRSGSTYQMPKRSFLKSAADANAQKIVNILKQGIFE